MIISYSEVFKWQTCKRQYYYRFILGRSPLEESEAIITGVKGHKLLQNFYEFLREGKSKEEALTATTKSASKLIKTEGFADFSLAKAWIPVDNYIRQTDFTSEAVLVENRFLVPARSLSDDPDMSDVQIGFTPDVVFKRTGDKYDIEDAKFVARAWSKSKMNRFPQLKLYQIFMEHMGYDVSRTILRFFNIATCKITPQNYTMTNIEKTTLIEDFFDGVREVIAFKRKPTELHKFAPRTMNYTACQFCAFEFPCTLEAEGKNANRTLETQYKKSDYDYNR